MAKLFTSTQFIDKLKHIATLPTVYYSAGNQWSSWNGSRWNFDCVVSIKSVLWGWNENKNVIHGGAIYKSNGVPDFTCNGGLNYCSDVSTDFRNLTPGEYLCMKGTNQDHVGIYLGNNEVFEVTTAWGVNGATISHIDSNGTRSKNGAKSLQWTYHGKLQWIDYAKVKYRAHIQDIGWQSWKQDGELAGTTGQAKRLEAIQIDSNKEVYAKAHIEDTGWVDYGKINKETIIGSTGKGKRLECLCLKGNFKYRVHIQDVGWSTWTNADGICTLGSVGQALRIEAIEII